MADRIAERRGNVALAGFRFKLDAAAAQLDRVLLSSPWKLQ